jgi:UPF0716 protein FxsA
MPILALVLLFLVVPLAELYVILKVGDVIGVLWTILILVADSVLGSILLRSQGRAVWRRFSEALQAGRMPHREVQHGVAVISGGALLITPGFLSDFLGLALLLPPSRALIIRQAQRVTARRMAKAADERRRRPRRGYDVEGSARDQPQPPTGPHRLER